MLVVENLHDVAGLDALEDLNFLLRQLPPGCALVLTSRTETTLTGVQEAKLTGRLQQLGACELAFSQPEIAALDLRLTPADVLQIWNLTEGWPALVRLMVLALDSAAPPDLRTLSLDDDLAGYLFAEAFARQDARTQHVLRVASVPEVVSADLAVGLSGDPGAGAVLQGAVDRSGLVSRWQQQEGAWYRLHPLLRSYLHHELVRHDRQAERDAQEMTARWLSEAGLHLAAVRHAVASRNADLQDEIVRVAGPRLINAGEAGLLLDVLRPSATLAGSGRTWSCLMRGAALLDLGRVEEAAGALYPFTAAQPGSTSSSPELDAAWWAAEVHLRRRHGSFPQAVELLRPVATEDPDLRLLLAVQRGSTLLRQREWDAAQTELDVGVELARGLGRPAALIDSLTFRSALHSARSEIGQTTADAREAIQIADYHGWGSSPRMSYAHLNSAWGAWQELNDGLARWHADRAAALLEPAAEPTIALAVRGMNLALRLSVHSAARDVVLLHEALVDHTAHDLGPITILHMGLIDARQSLVHRRYDRIEDVLRVIRERVGDCGELVLVEALLCQKQGRDSEALELLRGLEDGSRPMATAVSSVEALTRIATLEPDAHVAVTTASRALRLAARLHAYRPLVDAGTPFADLLRGGRGRWGDGEQVVDRVLGHNPAPEQPQSALTPRELHLLRELPRPETTEELAATLFVSINTVKTHQRNLYRKLGVSSRRAAVTEARRLGYL